MPDMEIFRITIGVENVTHRGVVRHIPDTLVDTGSELTWIPRNILQSIDIAVERRRNFIVADGRHIERDIGYAVVHASGSATVDEVVFAEESDFALLGVRSLEGLNLRIDVVKKQLVDAGPVPAAQVSAFIESRSAAAATASLSAGAGARSHDPIPHNRSSSDARSSRFMLVNK